MTPAIERQLKILFGVLACVLIFWARFAYLHNIPDESAKIVLKPGWFGSVYVDAIEDEGSFYSAESRTVIHQYRPISPLLLLAVMGGVYFVTAEIVVPTLLGRTPRVGAPRPRR
ncbi:MAG: hypothetical protein KC466_09040 [Myxococcales bacterium]|nr:hypothetical protein [Myxococcales bacterium]